MRNSLLLFILFLGLSFSHAQKNEILINELLNSWHHSAAIADGETFFNLMTENAHYIGTDEDENWTRNEMKEWSQEIFKRDSAWDFKLKKRNLYLNHDETIAWFDETLDTWMGVCRGSGVVILTKNGWKIQHYVLSVAVSNYKIDDYLKILEK